MHGYSMGVGMGTGTGVGVGVWGCLMVGGGREGGSGAEWCVVHGRPCGWC